MKNINRCQFSLKALDGNSFLFILYVGIKISNFVLVLLEKVSDYVDLNLFFFF